MRYLSSPVCPAGNSGLRFGEGACTGQPPLSYVYKSRALPPLPGRLSSISFPTLPRSSLIHALSTPPAWTHPESSFVGLATAENHGGTAGLKPESLISHSGVDALQSLRWRSFPLSQLDWLRSKHNHRLYSLSSLSHHHNPHDNASLVITTALVCLGSASMRCDLSNCRNASWRRG